MKTNKWIRLAAILCILCLLTTSVISGTFAKYTTQDAASDTARVAKWGVALQVAGNLFGGHYNSTSHEPLAWTAADVASVSASESGTDVVAPGTKSSEGFKFSVNGVPEVSGTVTTTISYENIYLKAGTYGVMVKYGKTSETFYNAIMASANAQDKFFVLDGTTYKLATAYGANTEYYTLEDYVVLASDYYPVEYTMTGTTTSYSSGDENTDTLAALVTAFVANLGTSGTATVAAGKTTNTWTKSFVPSTDLATDLKIEDQVITWKWDFENNGTATGGDSASVKDKADTILGNLQAGTTTVLKGTVVKLDGTDYVAPVAAAGILANDFNLETEFSVDITITQVD